MSLFSKRARRVRGRERKRRAKPSVELFEKRLLLAMIPLVVTNTNDSGRGSLRQAILDSNGASGATNTIDFDIPGAGVQTIFPLSPLPTITVPVIIDGYTQPGSSPNTLANGDNAVLLITLDGTLAGQYADGLEISAGGSTVRGLVIDHFREGPNPSSPTGFSGGQGIYLLSGGGNTIQGNFIGTDASGTVAAGNEGVGTLIESSPNNLVGGLTPAARNLIAGNPGGAIDLDNFSGPDAPGNLIENNYINTDKSGTSRLGGGTGVNIAGVSHNTVGGLVGAARNIISGGDFSGVVFQAGATSNLVQGNFIGTDVTGAFALGNAREGVFILTGATNNTIGGTTGGALNVISGNAQNGVEISGSGTSGNVVEGNNIGTNVTGTSALANANDGVSIDTGATNNTIGGTAAAARNVISGNAGDGIDIFGTGTSNNLVDGNDIGVNAAGNIALPNGTPTASTVGIGIYIFGGASANIIGGQTNSARNVISGNLLDGILISDLGTSGNLIEGNYIGTDVSGTAALPNQLDGISIDSGATANTIGGTAPGSGNVISGNSADGIGIGAPSLSIGAPSLSSDGNLVQGNKIGTNAAGTAALGNGNPVVNANGAGGAGVRFFAGTFNTVENNVISGNVNEGIFFHGGASHEMVLGNLVGTNFDGTAAIPNGLDGISLLTSVGNTISGNVISGNGNPSSTSNGIKLASADDNLIQANLIGTDASGTRALPNISDGVFVSGSNNTIGGTAAAARNVISGNANDGVDITGSGTSGNVVEGNNIGTDATGTIAIGNGGSGVSVFSSNNTIGGTGLAARNLISGNGLDGVDLTNASATDNLVEGNFIGTDATGGAKLGNARHGVAITSVTGSTSQSGSNNTIGGSVAGAGNLISGNGSFGVVIFGPDGGATGNVVQGNLIGTDASGEHDLGNTGDGIVISSAADNTVGGTGISARNVIAGSGRYGVVIESTTSTGNLIQNNFIGTDKSGILAIGNALDGVIIQLGASGNTVGGVASGAGDLISGNVENGVEITDAGTSGNLVIGNRIGTTSDGTAALPNQLDGISIDSGATSNTIGGTTTGARNVISGNSADGIDLTGSGSTANVIEGSLIGTDATGTAALGNLGTGVSINGASANTIGGTAPGSGNLISGNSADGIDLTGSASTANLIEGNFIGTDVTGTAPLGNLSAGIAINDASANTVGGTAVGSGNLISGNSGYGVSVTGTANAITGNLIGTSANGDAPLGNTSDGIFLTGASSNSITGNVISGNGIGQSAAGIDLTANSSNNTIADNMIGTNSGGTAGLGNSLAGILVGDGSSGNTIGSANTIGFNGTGIDFSSGATANVVLGNFIGTNAAGANLGNVGPGVLISAAPNNTIGGTASGLENVIAANGGSGITIVGASENGVYFDSTGNILIGNLIGTDGTGSKALGNLGAGVSIQNATHNTVGPGNVISGNGMAGVDLLGSVIAGVFRGATSNTINSNKIGTNSDGTAAVPNGLDGILLTDAATNSISGNVISGNGASGQEAAGIDILNVNSTGNVVAGNLIGTDVTGTFAVGNSLHGVFVGNGASRNVIGPGNVISGSGGPLVQGVGVYLDGTATQSNSVIGNFIGINKAGNAAIAGSSVGVLISNAQNNVVGGVDSADRNIISGNSGVGVYIALAGATGNVVQNNYIGTDVSGLAGIPNGVDGIYINGAPGNLIGGTGQGTGNLISANQSAGIQIYGAGASGNQFFRNRIGLDANGRPSLPNRITGIFSQISIQVNAFGIGTGNQNIGQVLPWQSPISIRDGTIIKARTQAKSRTRRQMSRATSLARSHHPLAKRKLPIATATHVHAKLALRLSSRGSNFVEGKRSLA